MRPADFARGTPRHYALPDDWRELRRRHAPLGPSASLDWAYEHVAQLGATSAMLEHEYLDRDYRDEYANFYVKTYRWVPDRCERLHFWSERRYLGYCSIRPIKGRPLGRTMLDPGPEFEHDVSCVIDARANPYGRRLVTPAFPFISQDRQYGRCAHAVIWMICHYHARRNDTTERFMSDIVEAAAETETERVVPSRGLTDPQIGATFRRLGLGAVVYPIRDRSDDADGAPNDSATILDQDQLERVVTRYLNSRIPLVLCTPGHMRAVVGARRTTSGALEAICCDDESGAYVPQSVIFAPEEMQEEELRNEDPWEVLFVPLPGRIYLLGEDMELPARDKLSELIGERDARTDVLDPATFRYREYVVDAREYKQRLRTRGLPGRTAAAHAAVGTARWIWVLELQDAELARQSPNCVLGEIAVDATSDPSDLVYLFANLPGLRAAWRHGEINPAVVAEPGPFEPYETGTALNL